MSTSCCFFRLTVNNLYEKNEKYQARNTCRMYVRVMGVRETQCEYCDVNQKVKPYYHTCHYTFENISLDTMNNRCQDYLFTFFRSFKIKIGTKQVNFH